MKIEVTAAHGRTGGHRRYPRAAGRPSPLPGSVGAQPDAGARGSPWVGGHTHWVPAGSQCRTQWGWSWTYRRRSWWRRLYLATGNVSTSATTKDSTEALIHVWYGKCTASAMFCQAPVHPGTLPGLMSW